MHNNYYFLRKLSAQLAEVLQGSVISECYSQQRDELIIRFETQQNSFYIKVTLSANLSCLSFPEDHQRSRKHTIDLFPALIGLHLKSVRQFENERSFAFVLTDNFTLLFKMHGNRSNLILFQDDVQVDAFRKNITADEEIKLDTLDRRIDFSREAFQENQHHLPSLYFTFGKPVWKHLESQGFMGLPAAAQWDVLQATVKQLEEAQQFYLVSNGIVALTLFPNDSVRDIFTDAIKATTTFYYRFVQHHAFAAAQTTMQSSLRQKIASSESFIRKNQGKLEEIERDNHYKVWADLIMANLHELRQGQEKVILGNFYNEYQPIEIKLKKDLSPQKNAETFYRKAKNQHIEITALRESIESKRKQISEMQAQLERLSMAPDLKAIRMLGDYAEKQEDRKKDIALPYHEFEFKGYRIWVGKDAARNDELTLKYGYKEDLWLHAKDVPGSHVLIKHQAGKNFPKDVIERAAQLAAYNSKRKTESLCPVVYTPKKFVRKRKGDPAGMVVVEKESVIMVAPSL